MVDRLPTIRPAGPTQNTSIQTGRAGFAFAAAFDTLAREAEQIKRDIIDPRRAEAAVGQAREDAENDALQRRYGTDITDQAYNNAAQAIILNRASRDADQKADELLQQWSSGEIDIEAFERASDEFASSYVSQMEPTWAMAAEGEIRSKMSGALRSVAANRRERIAKEAEESTMMRRAQATKELMTLSQEFGQDAVNQPEFKKAMADFDATTEFLRNNPLIPYSDERAEQDRMALFSDLETSILTPEVDAAYAKGGYFAALQTAEDLAMDTGRVRSNEERRALQSRLVERASFLDRKEAAKYSAMIRAEALTNAAVKRQADDAEKQMLSLAISGQLTADWLLENQGRMDAAGLSRGYTIITSSDTAPADDAYALDLRRRKRRGEDVSGEVLDALGQGRINLSMATQIDDLEGIDGQLIGPGRDLIEAIFSQGLLDFSGETAQREDEAQYRLENWLRNNPEATRDDVREEAKRIVNVMGRQALNNPELPALRGGARPGSSKALDDWKALIDQEFLAKRVTEEKYYEQMELYEQWAAAIALKEAE